MRKTRRTLRCVILTELFSLCSATRSNIAACSLFSDSFFGENCVHCIENCMVLAVLYLNVQLLTIIDNGIPVEYMTYYSHPSDCWKHCY